MDPETLRLLFRAEAEKLKLELQQDNGRWREDIRQDLAMQQQMFSFQRNSLVAMMQQVHVKMDQQVSTVNERFAELKTQIASIQMTPPTTASSSLQTKLSLSTKASKRGQPEPDGDASYFSTGVDEWFEGWDEPHWARAYPAPSESATQMSASAAGASASLFGIDPSEVPSLSAESVSGDAPTVQHVNDCPVPVLSAALTAENLSALDMLPHNPRRCMLCKRLFVHTRQCSFPCSQHLQHAQAHT